MNAEEKYSRKELQRYLLPKEIELLETLSDRCQQAATICRMIDISFNVAYNLCNHLKRQLK